MTNKLKRGDSVRVSHWYGNRPVTGTVTQVGRFMVRVLFPIRKFSWVPIECCETITRRKR
jgi:hypothetical protein